MQNPKDFPNNAPSLFDEVGGEPLAGSGFETENPDLDFAQAELFQMERQTPEEE